MLRAYVFVIFTREIRRCLKRYIARELCLSIKPRWSDLGDVPPPMGTARWGQQGELAALGALVVRVRRGRRMRSRAMPVGAIG